MFDYVVVGAGSAGCVLAARLSEDPGVRVCLIEAGGSDRHPNVRIPAAFPKLFRTGRDWAFTTEPEPALAGRSLSVPRGRMLGGSSSMNAMLFVRGNAADYDGWARATGDPGWSYQEVLPRFRAMEDWAGGADDYRGVGGPLHVAPLRSPTEMTGRILDAAAAVGVGRADDYNGANQEGAAPSQVTQRNGARWSAVDAWLRPALGRPNLTVLTDVLATCVVWDGTTAVGVAVHGRRGSGVVRAAREVVLAAGAIGSPHLLLRSGIGPADHLRAYGVAVVHDNPHVGSHLQDHPFVTLNFETTQPGTLFEAERPAALAAYLARRTGLLSSNIAEAVAFTRVAGAALPNLQLHAAPAYYRNHGFETSPRPAYAIGPTVIQPESRGTVRLRSADPHHSPSIRGNHLTEPRDLDVMVAGVQLAREMAASAALAPVTVRELSPGPGSTARADLVRAIRAECELIYHPAGTARMGREGDGVVGPDLLVHGVAHLSVADASVFPTIPRGNPNAATYLVAHRAADLLPTRP